MSIDPDDITTADITFRIREIQQCIAPEWYRDREYRDSDVLSEAARRLEACETALSLCRQERDQFKRQYEEAIS